MAPWPGRNASSIELQNVKGDNGSGFEGISNASAMSRYSQI